MLKIFYLFVKLWRNFEMSLGNENIENMVFKINFGINEVMCMEALWRMSFLWTKLTHVGSTA